MKEPLISILMPNHNGGNYIAEAIQSVLNQTCEDYELLIIEDASSDNSREIIQQFEDERIRVIQNATNEHICVSLNRGLKEARGKYIARLDSDDRWYPDKLEKQLAYMESHNNCGATFSWVNVIDEQGKSLTAEESFFVELFRAKNRSRDQWIRDFFFEGSCLCHPSAMLRRDVVTELGGYRNSLVQIQDFDLWTRIVKCCEIYVFEEALMDYRHALKGGNVSAQTQTNCMRTDYELYNVLTHYFDDLTDQEFKRIFAADFKRPDAAPHNELNCERALMMLEPLRCGNVAKLGGMDLLARLIDDEETRIMLRDVYGITQHNFYQLSGSPSLWREVEPRVESFDYDSLSAGRLVRLMVRKILKACPPLFRLADRTYHLIKKQ